MFWSVYVSQKDYFGMLALSKWEMSKQINCLIHIGSWQIDLEILFFPIRCCFWDGLFHIFLCRLWGLWLMLLRLERQFSSSGRYLTKCFKKSFYHLFYQFRYFISPLYRVMVTSTSRAGTNSLFKYLSPFPSFSIYCYFFPNSYKAPDLKLCRILVTSYHHLILNKLFCWKQTCEKLLPALSNKDFQVIYGHTFSYFLYFS